MIKFKHNSRDKFYDLAYDTLLVVADELKREIEKHRANEVDNNTINRLEKSFAERIHNYYEPLRQNLRQNLQRTSSLWQQDHFFKVMTYTFDDRMSKYNI